MIPDEAVEAAPIAYQSALEGTGQPLWDDLPQQRRDSRMRWMRKALEAATLSLGAARTEVGYVCRHGHFQFRDDPDGDTCGTKNAGRIYVEAKPEITPIELAEAIGDALEGHHRTMEEWRAL